VQPVLPGVTAPAQQQVQPGVVVPGQPAVNPPAAIINHSVFQPAGVNGAQSGGATTSIGIAGAGILLVAGGYLLRRRRDRSA
jgi:LPXTG-motif cell wall-anchored protein